MTRVKERLSVDEPNVSVGAAGAGPDGASASVSALGMTGPVNPVVLSIDAVDEALRALDQQVRRGLGVNNGDVLALQFIDRRQRRGQLTRVRDLVPRLGVSSGTATTMTQRLERAGLLNSEPDDTDGRGRVLRVTARAEDLIRGLLGPVRAQLEELLASIDSDEQARLIELLDSVRDILQPSTGGAGR